MYTLLWARREKQMRLKRLEIVGFKSFADPFRIDFNKGISAIVGPNGCGKSNVADAVRWVLGNQSPRQLRADRMESVIFSGSSRRKQLGMAEVVLTFDNTDRQLGLDYDEVSVSRKLFRTGDSEYSINGSRCRLMDITDLVVDKGLGSTGYWILESKMVGIILSNRPEDRRSLFDEAAGIVRYKIQRHRAELKLNSAANDLERLSDIIMEVESTCNGLKRQVSAYNRHRKVSDSIKAITEAMNFIESSEISEKLKEKENILDETGSVVGRETASLASATVVLEEARMEFARVQRRLDESHRKCAELDSELASNDRETAVTAERIASAEMRIAENNARMAVERERILRYTVDMEKLGDERVQLRDSLKKLDEEHAAAVEKLDQLKLRREQAGIRLDTARSERAKADSLLEQMRQSFRERIRGEEARIQKISSLKESLKVYAEKSSSLDAGLSALKLELKELTRENSVISSTLQKELNTREMLLADTADLGAKLSQAGQTAAVLQDQVTRVNDLLKQFTVEDSISSVIKPLPGMGKAVGAFLDSFNSAAVAGSVPENSSPGARFAVPVKMFAGTLPQGAVPLGECVEKADSGSFINSLLSHCVLAPDTATAGLWMEQGLAVTAVTAGGDIFRPDGLVRLGVAETGAGSLELKDILDDLHTRLQKAVSERDGLAQSLAGKNLELSANRERTDEARSRLSENEKKLAASQNSQESLEKQLESTVNSISAIEERLKLLEKTETEQAGTATEQGISDLEEKRAEALLAEEEALAAVSREDNLIAEAERNHDNCSFNLRENRSRQKEIEGRVELLAGEAESIQELLAGLQRENEKLGSSVSSMQARQKVLEKQSVVLKSSRGGEESRRNDYSRERNTLMESTAVLEKEVQQTRERLGRAKTLMIELEAQTLALQEKLKAIEEQCTVEDNPFLGRSPGELADELSSRNSVLERIGPVNMLAVSEYEEARERLDYLTGQRDDLEKARASLSRAISEINSEAAARFQETFQKVRENFQKMFVKLFDGGEGDIVSVESDDPLEGGIDILARPRGKKLKNVIALSAGERALTAVALLFSLYLVKPSPFCVLDELDSPFDDSNTDKFIEILREFADNTQFIVITHNKRTMEGSDVLYGITMAEEGVSTITSVNLEEMVQTVEP